MMNEYIVAKAFLYVDDPYGDGIRLEHVRNPSAARIVAKDLVHDGYFSFNALEIMLAERGDEIKHALRTKSGRADMVRNGKLSENEVEILSNSI